MNKNGIFLEIIKNEDIDKIIDLIINSRIIDQGINFRDQDCPNDQMLANSNPNPLMIAAYFGKEESFNFLLTNGAKSDVIDNFGVLFSYFSYFYLSFSFSFLFFLYFIYL